MNVLDELIHNTLRIEVHYNHGGRGSGTGFICNFAQRDSGKHVPAVVTNKHVVEGAVMGTFHMTVANNDGLPDYGNHVLVPMLNFDALCVKHPNNDVDLAAFPLVPILEWIKQKNKNPFYKSVPRDYWADAAFMNELSAVEDIMMVGYPNGLWDSINNLPITRRGTTATAPYIDFEGKPQFMIDCACFPGSSGSPVFLLNMGGYLSKGGVMKLGMRIKLLGILWGGPQHTAEGEIKVVPVPSAMQPVALSRIPNNLGYCIKAEQLLEFDKHFDKLLEAEEAAKKSQEAGAA